MVRARESADERPDLARRPVAKGGIHELERCRPAFGPRGDIGKDVRVQVAAIGLAEQAIRLVGIEAQVVGGQLRDLAGRSQPGDRDPRRASAGEDDGQSLRGTRDDLAGDELDIGRLVHEVEVVEDQDRAVWRDRAQLADEDVDDRVAGRSAQARVGEHRRRVRRERRIDFAARGDQVVEHRDPVAIVVVEPVPQRAQPGPAREVGEERGLAVAGIGQQQDDPLVDLRGEPVEEPVARQGLLAQRRRLDLRVLDREAAHVVAVGSADLRGDGGSPTWTDRHQRALDRSLPDAGQRGPGERYGALALGVNGQIRTGHAGMVTTDPHPSLNCDAFAAMRLVGEQRAEGQRVDLAVGRARQDHPLEASGHGTETERLDVGRADRLRPELEGVRVGREREVGRLDRRPRPCDRADLARAVHQDGAVRGRA